MGAQDQRLGGTARWSCHPWQCSPEAFHSVLQVSAAEPCSCCKPERLKAAGQTQQVSAKLSCQDDRAHSRNTSEPACEAEQNLQFWIHKWAEMSGVCYDCECSRCHLFLEGKKPYCHDRTQNCPLHFCQWFPNCSVSSKAPFLIVSQAQKQKSVLLLDCSLCPSEVICRPKESYRLKTTD